MHIIPQHEITRKSHNGQNTGFCPAGSIGSHLPFCLAVYGDVVIAIGNITVFQRVTLEFVLQAV